MRKSALAGLFALVAIFVTTSSSQVSAESLDPLKITKTDQKLISISALETIEQKARPQVEEPKVHAVGNGENLSLIAEKYATPWIRIFNKNENISHPDVIKEGDKIVIPLPDEELKERPLPEPPVIEPVVVADAPEPRQAPSTVRRNSAPAPSVSRGSVAGNTYTPGYCTWYAKNMRPDMPNNLGNANTWVSRAAAQGMATGSVPRAGAIGQQGMHVVYVQSVNGDGTVTISEMNYKGLFVVSTRTVPASTFMYIY